jgi:hypothetical protein
MEAINNATTKAKRFYSGGIIGSNWNHQRPGLASASMPAESF